MLFTLTYNIVTQIYDYDFKNTGGTFSDSNMHINQWTFIKI